MELRNSALIVAAVFLLASCTPSPTSEGTYTDECRSCLDEDSFNSNRKIFCDSDISGAREEFVLVEEDVTFLPGSISGYDPRVNPDTSCVDETGNPVSDVYTGGGYCSLGGYRDPGDFEIRFQLRDPHPPPLNADDPLDIYARTGVGIPDFIHCNNTDDSGRTGITTERIRTELEATGEFAAGPSPPLFITGSPGYGTMNALPSPPNFINYNGSIWMFFRNISANRGASPATSPRELSGPGDWRVGDPPTVTLDGTELEVYYDLLENVRSDEAIFLVEPGNLDPSGPDPVPFLEYYLSTETDLGNNRGLQLETFKPISCQGYGWWSCWVMLGKPVIYLYPEETTTLGVKLFPNGRIRTSDPVYPPDTGWLVTARPDGTIYTQNTTYPYLFYELDLLDYVVPKKGFVVQESEVGTFLDDTLPKLGLKDHEISDFKDYWLPRVAERGTPYFFITFLPHDEIERIDRVVLTQPPDTEIRITAVFRGLEEPESVEPLELPTPSERKGFTMVEWGGILE